MITGITSTWGLGLGAIEMGARVEQDRPVDRDGTVQSYVDTRVRYVAGLARAFPGLTSRLHGGNVRANATLGWFAYNRTYCARPDNTGLALFRYAGHVELSLFDDHLALGVDATFFTDRDASSVLRPSEVDLAPELILRHSDFELHVAFETDQPIDRSGLVQKFAYALAVWGF